MLNTEQINKLILINKDATVKDAFEMDEKTFIDLLVDNYNKNIILYSERLKLNHG
jgi:hypothetical protein